MVETQNFIKMGEDMAQGEHWLNKERFTVYPRIMLAMFFIIALIIICQSNLVNSKGDTLDSDLGVFWTASHLALAGHPLDAYDPIRLWQADLRIDGAAIEGQFGWFYPPTFYLVILPLALFPYFVSYLGFMLVTLVGYVAVIRRIVPGREVLWCLAGFSGVWLNIRLGQNGFLTAALAGAALLSLERRPVLSGLFIGLLSIKPHLVLLFPVALVAIGAWRTLFTAAIVAIVFMLASTFILGADTITAWLHSIDLARSLLETKGGFGYWVNMPTMFAFLRLLDVPVREAYMGQALVALVALVAVWRIWRNSGSVPLRSACLITATLLVSPYLLEYDLAWLALAIAWLVKLGLEDGWLRAEREVLVAIWLLPFSLFLIASVTSIQIGPWVLLTLLWMILRRSSISLRRGKTDKFAPQTN